jgi:hypothetical protein
MCELELSDAHDFAEQLDSTNIFHYETSMVWALFWWEYLSVSSHTTSLSRQASSTDETSQQEFHEALESLQSALLECLPHLSEDTLVDMLEFIAVQHPGSTFQPDNSEQAPAICEFVKHRPFAVTMVGVARCVASNPPPPQCLVSTHSAFRCGLCPFHVPAGSFGSHSLAPSCLSLARLARYALEKSGGTVCRMHHMNNRPAKGPG